MTIKIAVVDYKINNVLSIVKAFKQINILSDVIDDISKLSNYKFIVIPGVGSFDRGMQGLNQMGFVSEFEKLVQNQHYFLGICLGMQLFFERSEEGNQNSIGLSAIKGKCKKLVLSNDISVPHVGWNIVNIFQDSPLTKNLDSKFHAYFVHSYYADLDNKKNLLAYSQHGLEFPAIVNNNNIFGVQFHPEKCQENGLKILENFTKLK